MTNRAARYTALVLVLLVTAAISAFGQEAGSTAVPTVAAVAADSATTELPGVDIGAYAFRITMYLALFVVLIWGGLFLVRKYLMPAGTGTGLRKSVRVLGQVPLGPRKSLYLVEMVDKVVVLGATDHNVNTVAEITDAAAIDTVKAEFQEGYHHQFSHYLGKVLGGAAGGKQG